MCCEEACNCVFSVVIRPKTVYNSLNAEVNTLYFAVVHGCAATAQAADPAPNRGPHLSNNQTDTLASSHTAASGWQLYVTELGPPARKGLEN